MHIWSQTHDLNSYELAEGDTVNYDLLMNYINKEFMIYHYASLKQHSDLEHTQPDYHLAGGYNTNSMTSTGINIDVNGVDVESRDLYAQDYQNINVWKTVDKFRTDKSFRSWFGGKSNGVPVWQRVGTSRPFDRSNDGYSATSERSSLNNNVYGYDMSAIYDTIGNNGSRHQDL